MNMKLRMNKADRRQQILGVMALLHKQVDCQAKFSVWVVAEASGVSATLVYRLVGPEYRKLRSTLKGPRRGGHQTVEGKLRRRVAELEGELNELKSRYRAEVQNDFAEAIRLIESLDEERRTWRTMAERYEKRVGEAEAEARKWRTELELLKYRLEKLEGESGLVKANESPQQEDSEAQINEANEISCGSDYSN
jgi:hypothetical protein